jgi:hypothetical protein
MATAVISKAADTDKARRRPPTRREIAVLLGLILLFCLSLELGTIVFFGRVSKIQRRFQAERQSALAVSKSATPAPSILIVGNSLLEEGINLPQLKSAVGSSANVNRYAVSNTSYLDWYYGLRRLFREGSHPDILIVMLNPSQLMSHGIAGDLAVRTMVGSRDLMKLAGNAGFDNTETSALFADRASAFYGSRGEIRNWALHAIFPKFEDIRSSLKPSPPQLPSNEEIAGKVTPRLRAMRQVCEENGTTMILLIPPSLSSDGSAGVAQASSALGIPVVAPFQPGELSPKLYSDGFHLNAQGAELFTGRVADALQSYVRPPQRVR